MHNGTVAKPESRPRRAVSLTAAGFYQQLGRGSAAWHLQLASWGRPFNHFGHFTANVVWVPSTFIHYWWENKCLSGILDAAITRLNHPLVMGCLLLHGWSSVWMLLWASTHFFFFFFSCVCAFLTVKRKKKKVKRFFFFFPAQAITALLGSSRLLPWQLPVNIPAEFFLSAEERVPLFSATDKSIGHSWRKCKGRRALPYLHMLEVMAQSDLTDLDASLQSGRGSERARIIVDQSVVQCSSWHFSS